MPDFKPHASFPLLRHAPRLLPYALIGSGVGLLLAAAVVGRILPPAARGVKPPAPPHPAPRKYTQPIAVFTAAVPSSSQINFFIERPDGSRVVGTSASKPVMRHSTLMGYTSVFAPDWLPGQPYLPDDLRLSGGMVGNQPALNMGGLYTIKASTYGQTTQPVQYSYTVICKIGDCNGKVFATHHGIAYPGAPQEAGTFTLPSPTPENSPVSSQAG